MKLFLYMCFYETSCNFEGNHFVKPANKSIEDNKDKQKMNSRFSASCFAMKLWLCGSVSLCNYLQCRK